MSGGVLCIFLWISLTIVLNSLGQFPLNRGRFSHSALLQLSLEYFQPYAQFVNSALKILFQAMN